MTRSSSSAAPSRSKPAGTPSPPRPSSSVVLLSPSNEVLLLHRVTTSTSFAAAHVFPGGNLDPFHDGDIPPADSPEHHLDGLAYRMGAIRECFEETGILLAKDQQGNLIQLEQGERDAMRKKVHSSEIKFGEWLKSIGATPDTAGLLPFTRWLTPPDRPKRFTTQMYLYLLPITRSSTPSQFLVPTPDGGVEHNSALFASPQHFLAASIPLPSPPPPSSPPPIILFPPQAYLLTLLSQHLLGGGDSIEEKPLQLRKERKNLLRFLHAVPTATTEAGKQHPTAQISWADKMICPSSLPIRREDGRAVLSLENSGDEVAGMGRGGDWERVVLVKFGKGGPSGVEVRTREAALAEAKGTKGQEKL